MREVPINQIVCGDALQVLRDWPENSIDAIVTDPPAGIAFMGREWDQDKGGRNKWIAWMTEIAKECLRVLKPGGHALVWSIARTSHWTAMAWEDAGFEIRDKIYHVFGSGFPKSLDVSKAIDKANGETGRLLRFTEWMRTTELTASRIDEITNTFMGSHYLTDKTQPAIPTSDLWQKLRPFCGKIPSWVDDLVSRIEADRAVVGRATNGCGNTSASIHKIEGFAASREPEFDITAPATDAAKQWQGWGTGLKPAIEEWHLFRKPLEGTVAENMQKWGVGGLNIDECRVSTEGEIVHTPQSDPAKRIGVVGTNLGISHTSVAKFQTAQAASIDRTNTLGRWPANLIHDGSEEVLRLFPQTRSGSGIKGKRSKVSCYSEPTQDLVTEWTGDSGSAARFFYCAKSSRAERNRGLEGPTLTLRDDLTPEELSYLASELTCLGVSL